MKRWKKRLSMEYGIEREDFNPNIVITSCLLGYCCRTVTLVTAKMINSCYTRVRVMIFAYYCTVVVVLVFPLVRKKTFRRFMKSDTSFYEK